MQKSCRHGNKHKLKLTFKILSSYQSAADLIDHGQIANLGKYHIFSIIVQFYISHRNISIIRRFH